MYYLLHYLYLSIFYPLIFIMGSLRSLLLFFVLCLFLGTSFAALSRDDFITVFETQEAPLSPTQRETYYKKVLTNLSLLISKNRDDEDQLAVFNWLKDYVATKLQNISPTNASSPLPSISLLSSGMNIANVDLEKVRAIWLSLHNIERATIWLTPFSYNYALEWTASTWANHLADIRTTSHKRKSGDGYYSYASIKKWFINQWISFLEKEEAGQSLFTENLGWNMYSCKKVDCTDDFIKAIKKSRSFFMSEKYRNYRPHYNAIMGDFSTLGLGVALVGNKYYLVSHYTQDLQ